MELHSGVILKLSPVWLVFSSQNRAVLMEGWEHMFWSLSPHSWCSKESLAGLKLFSPPLPPSFSIPPLYLFPPSHLIAFDKCPYWLHIIRCSGGSVRLYYSAHIPHLFSILHGWHTCFCEVRMGPRLCQWNSFMSRCSIGQGKSWWEHWTWLPMPLLIF